MMEILKAALPHVSTIVELIQLAIKSHSDTLSEDDIRNEIQAISSWMKDANEQEWKTARGE